MEPITHPNEERSDEDSKPYPAGPSVRRDWREREIFELRGREGQETKEDSLPWNSLQTMTAPMTIAVENSYIYTSYPSARAVDVIYDWLMKKKTMAD